MPSRCDQHGLDLVTRFLPTPRLTVATNAIVCWSTEYHGLGVAALRRTGRDVDDEVLAHIWPTHHENVHFYGTHSVDIDGELAQLDIDGYRPLRLSGITTATIT